MNMSLSMYSPDIKKYRMNNSLLSMRFPQKLWKMTNECKSGAIQWGADGTSIVLDYPKFQSEFLDHQLPVFRTCSIRSIVRQLNLYGFKKISRHYVPLNNRNIHEYGNENFIRGRHELLQKLSRKRRAVNRRQPFRLMQEIILPLRKKQDTKQQVCYKEVLQCYKFVKILPAMLQEKDAQSINKPILEKSVALQNIKKEMDGGIYIPKCTAEREVSYCSRKGNEMSQRPLDASLSQAVISNLPSISSMQNKLNTNMYLHSPAMLQEKDAQSINKPILEKSVALQNIKKKMDGGTYIPKCKAEREVPYCSRKGNEMSQRPLDASLSQAVISNLPSLSSVQNSLNTNMYLHPQPSPNPSFLGDDKEFYGSSFEDTMDIERAISQMDPNMVEKVYQIILDYAASIDVNNCDENYGPNPISTNDMMINQLINQLKTNYMMINQLNDKSAKSKTEPKDEIVMPASSNATGMLLPLNEKNDQIHNVAKGWNPS